MARKWLVGIFVSFVILLGGLWFSFRPVPDLILRYSERVNKDLFTSPQQKYPGDSIILHCVVNDFYQAKKPLSVSIENDWIDFIVRDSEIDVKRIRLFYDSNQNIVPKPIKDASWKIEITTDNRVISLAESN